MHTFDEPLETDITLAAVVGRELLADLERGKPELVVGATWTWLRFSPRQPVDAWRAADYAPLPGGHERGPFFQVSVGRGGALEPRVAHAAR